MGLWLLWPAPAVADLLALEPGKRISGHQGIDCDKCHTSGSGVSRDKCLGCHEHTPLAKRIAAKEGLHARRDFAKSCESCHQDHKGANFDPINWSPLGGQKRFDHGLTGYTLEGAHKRQSCTSCHKATHEKSKRTTFLGLDANCISCHEDVHRFEKTNPDLMNCRVCHSFDARAVTTARGLEFNHGKVANFPLRGKHGDAKCSTCHTSTTVFKMKERPERCVDCHKDPHENVYTQKSRDCVKCHSDEKKRFDSGSFAHNKETRFPLRNKHRIQNCQKCHAPKDAAPPKASCTECHQEDSVHVVGQEDRFAGRDCAQCHNDSGFRKLSPFDHDKFAQFPLEGKHGAVSCADCHRKKPKAQVKVARDTFEFFPSQACVGCHAHDNAHQRNFHDRPQLCAKCHVAGSSNIKSPPHSELSANFEQQGAHAKVKCAQCHGENLVRLTPGDDCASCHANDDAHAGTLGATCKQCHLEGFPWSNVIFDHDTQSSYPLAGRHEVVACNRCHTDAPKAFKPLKNRCINCHGAQDVHQGKLGTDCDRCHDMNGGSSLFDHNTMTGYPLEAAHARADCRGCHFEQSAAATTPAQWVLDLGFAVAGARCADCHGDPHGLRPGASCEGCHDAESFHNRPPGFGAGDGEESTGVPNPDAGSAQHVFAPPPRDAAGATTPSPLPTARDEYHNVPPFSLDAGHSRLECHRCHGARGDLTGMAQACDTCHRKDDIHAGSLGPSCADCHTQRAFAPARFSHTAVGFSLVGAHRLLSCKNCHAAGNYMGLSGECLSCHADDAARAEKTSGMPHIGFLGQPCLNCHNQVSWLLNPFLRRRF